MPSNSIDFRWTLGEGTRRVECQTGHAEIIGTVGAIAACDTILVSGGSACGLARTFVPLRPTRVRGICARGHTQEVASGTSSVCPTRICGLTRKAVASGPYVYDPTNSALKTLVQGVLTWP